VRVAARIGAAARVRLPERSLAGLHVKEAHLDANAPLRLLNRSDDEAVRVQLAPAIEGDV